MNEYWAICCPVSLSVYMLIPRDVTVVRWGGVRCWWVCQSGSAHRREERLPRLAGEGACPSGRPRNRLFSNVQLPIIPAVINHPTLTNEVEQSASQSATQHTTTHSPPCLAVSALWYHSDIGHRSYPILNSLSVLFFLLSFYRYFEISNRKEFISPVLLSENNVSHGHKELHF